MSNNAASKRSLWVDNVKLLACILVALGHFLQSMVRAQIYPNNDFWAWIDKSLYTFHVPLFFICSGFLYQEYSKSECNFKSHAYNTLNKLIAYSVPYVFFTIVTYTIKTVFSRDVNTEVGEGILDIIFISPTAPYWYLYALFFIFLVTPRLKSDKLFVIMFCAALIFKIVSILDFKTNIYAVDTLFANEIWFLIGMVISRFRFLKFAENRRSVFIAVAGMMIFIAFSILAYIFKAGQAIDFVLGLLMCFSVISFFMAFLSGRAESSRFMKLASKYTMPIYLMHTIFAAAVRILLLKLGIDSVIIHTFFGISASIALPIIAAFIMEKLHPLDFLLYPSKYIKLKKKEA